MSNLPLSQDACLRDAVRAIEQSRKTIAIVVDERGILLGTISDGDIRRALLSGQTLDSPVTRALNRNPVTAPPQSSDRHLLALLRDHGIEALPLVDEAGRFLRIVHQLDLDTDEVFLRAEGFAAAVIMAGGQGKRLGDYTKTVPKPMIEVGGMPLLERQVHTLVRVGVPRIFVSVNYLGHVIERHFGDGSAFGARISYLREPKALGTAGALSLLPRPIQGPLLVMNGDVLTASDYGHLLAYHRQQNAHITVGAVEYHVAIPFGVIVTEGTEAKALVEKPSQRFLCNAGIYVLSPEAVTSVPEDRFFNMTELIECRLQAGERVSVFLIHEYWADIGTPADLAEARRAATGLARTP